MSTGHIDGSGPSLRFATDVSVCRSGSSGTPHWRHTRAGGWVFGTAADPGTGAGQGGRLRPHGFREDANAEEDLAIGCPCECDLVLNWSKFLTTSQYAPRLRNRLAVEQQLLDDATVRGWQREIERHTAIQRRILQLLRDLL
jgi:hypothetical protein